MTDSRACRTHHCRSRGAHPFPHRHLLGIAGLRPWEIGFLLDEAEQWIALNRATAKHDDRLAGLTQINAFFENSTRTLLSFEIAGKRLGMDVVNMHAAQSSVKKGETLIDTAVDAQRDAPRRDRDPPRRHRARWQLIADKVDCPVLNAGDGRHEHPTQALLDALTIRRRIGPDRRARSSTICGDVLHSRVARSNILALTTLGAEVRVVAPPTLLPPAIERMGVTAFTDFDAALDGAEVVMMLRLQLERMAGAFVPSRARISRASTASPASGWAAPRRDALVMHPGPMNRGIEITSDVADDPRVSAITEQVEMGVAVRMACLDVLTRRRRGVEGWA